MAGRTCCHSSGPLPGASAGSLLIQGLFSRRLYQPIGATKRPAMIVSQSLTKKSAWAKEPALTEPSEPMPISASRKIQSLSFSKKSGVNSPK